MHTHAEKTGESKSRPTIDPASKTNDGAAFQFADRRPEAVAQRALQTAASGFSSRQQPVQKKANATGLPDNLKSGIEQLSGYAMDDVKVHYNSSKPDQLHAHAYAQGTDIHVAAGQEKHLAHEAWHVVQQKQGRVKPTRQLKGKVAVNDDAGLEKEADAMGQKALGQPETGDIAQLKSGHGNGCGCGACTGAVMAAHAPVQRCPKCADPSCKTGEKCGMSDDLDGLFPVGTSADPVKFYNQQQGHGGLPREWEHPLAKAAMKQSGLGHLYSSSPVIGMPKSVHRGGVDGMGGGVSSTGSSHTSTGWAKEVATVVKADGVAAGIQKGLIDDINSYAMQGLLREDHKSSFVQLVRGFVQKGAITGPEGDLMGAELLHHIDFALKYIKG